MRNYSSNNSKFWILLSLIVFCKGIVDIFQDMDDAGKGQTKHPDEEDALQVVQGEGETLLYLGILN